jgi:predicted phage terminase large subunit-like protein
LPGGDLNYVIQSWDTANRADAGSDYSACVTVLCDEDKNQYVIDVMRERLWYGDLLEAAISQARQHKPLVILVENAGVGRHLVNDLKARMLPAFAVAPEGDKVTRLSIQSGKFANGQILFPSDAAWLAALEDELFAFPNGRYDDQVDALVQALGDLPAGIWTPAALGGIRTS